METTVVQQVTLSTAILQDLVSRAVKGAKCVELIPLTCMMRLHVQDNMLSVSTTDNLNWLNTFAKVQANDFDVIVSAKTFSQIIAKISTDTVTLSIKDSSVIIKGNGTYTIPVSTETDGSEIKWEEPDFLGKSNIVTLTYDEVKSIITWSKSCKADNKEQPYLYNYFFDTDCILTSDSEKACINKISAVDEPTALTPDLVDLIQYVTHSTEGVTVQTSEDAILFSSSIGSLYGKKCLQSDVDAFPNKAIKQILQDSTYTNTCVVQRTQLNAALDRMIVFTDNLHRNKITFTCKSDKLNLVNEDAGSNEDIIYSDQNETKVSEEISFALDAKYLQTIISNCGQEKLKIQMDSANGIKIDLNKESSMMLSVLE